MGSGDSVRVVILPSSSCSYEDSVRITVSGLEPRQRVELRSLLQDDKGVVFRAAARYQADGSGELDLSRHASLGGSYTGVEPMGLFWSMEADVPHSKVVKRDASTPLFVHIEASSGGKTLAQATNERHFAVQGVRRVPVRDGRIRGTLFIPPGEGPFPAVVDLYTLGGILCEPRAALLASNGFVTLALALYGYQDMPRKVDKIELEYFEEALTFLQNLPEVSKVKPHVCHLKVKKTGVGIVSISKSGELALAMASFLPNVKATAWINGNIANVLFPLHYKDIVLPPLSENVERITTTASGILDIRDVLNDPMDKENRSRVIPIERASCNFLFIASEDDRNWNSVYYAEQASKILKAHGKTNYEVVTYPKAGHFLEIPYMPFYPSGIHAAVGQAVAFGGEPKAHAVAQVDTWKRLLEFFKKHLEFADGRLKSLL
ncbi:acyl-coenzyme A thioesterase 3-like isoform X3 [Astyanax mexicanus]|uniref:Acyl-coenzyme A thioesterase 3-like isoform X3 n=1 Tax=Astyanax mexicanus TaxID=7994 RepID=A0A8T2MNI8_ASTMX|nr:acyl-coenzyme A thioesterase 3-like isoform X3 [Astyanax mexicanus]